MTNLTKALLKVQQEMGAIAKDSKNPFFKSSYLSLNGLREAVLPILSDKGIVLLQPTVYRDGKSFVATQLIHAETGEMIEGLTEIVSKNAGDAQQFGSGVSYSRRYGLMSILCLSAEDDDGNAATGKTQAKPVVKVEAAPAAQVVSTGTVQTSAASAAPTKAKVSFSKKAAPAPATATDGDI